jgi:uncharacterized protein YlxW (UPF0749 family)
VEYRNRISTLKKEVQYAREGLNKLNCEVYETKEKANSTQAIYSLLDEQTKERVMFDDVKVRL